MNLLLATAVGLGICALATSALAGRDAGEFEGAIKATPITAASPSAAPHTSTTTVVLPLDHGPHAVTTPWANRQLLRKAQAAASARQP